MFRYCVWYLLKNSHIINGILMNNSKQLKTPIFPGHITIKHSLNKNQAEDIFDKYSKKEKPFFLRFGQPIYSSTRIGKNMFHAIEQPLKVCRGELPEAHVSMAYRTNGNAFTKDDINKINTSTFNIIYNNFTLCIADCFSENPSEWTVIKKF